MQKHVDMSHEITQIHQSRPNERYELLKLVNNSLRTLIMNNDSQKLKLIYHNKFLKLSKSLKNVFEESKARSTGKRQVSNENGILNSWMN